MPPAWDNLYYERAVFIIFVHEHAKTMRIGADAHASFVLDLQMNLDMNFLSGSSPLMTELYLLISSKGVSVGLGVK